MLDFLQADVPVVYQHCTLVWTQIPKSNSGPKGSKKIGNFLPHQHMQTFLVPLVLIWHLGLDFCMVTS